jgi:hypothetical protein
MNPNLPPLATVRDQVADWLLLSRSIPAGAIIDTATPAVVALRAIRDDAGIIVTTLHEGLTDAEAERDALHARAEAAEAERDALRARALIADQWRAFALEVALQVAPLGEEQRAAQTTVRDLPAVAEALREVVAERDRADQRADRAYAYKVVAENEAAALRARAEVLQVFAGSVALALTGAGAAADDLPDLLDVLGVALDDRASLRAEVEYQRARAEAAEAKAKQAADDHDFLARQIGAAAIASTLAPGESLVREPGETRHVIVGVVERLVARAHTAEATAARLSAANVRLMRRLGPALGAWKAAADELAKMGQRAVAAEAALATARAEGAAAERAAIAATLTTRAAVLRDRKALGAAEEVEALAFYVTQRGGGDA